MPITDDALRVLAQTQRQMLDAMGGMGTILKQHTTMLEDILDLLRSKEESPLEVLLAQLVAAIGAQTAAINQLEGSITRLVEKP